MKDHLNNDFVVGDKVVRGIVYGRSPDLVVQTVTKIEDGKVYLDDSKQAIRCPDRLLIITKLFQK